MKNFLFLISAIVLSTNLQAQKDEVGSGRAIRFDAIDDFIDLGNIYDDLQFPITISAWVYVEPSTQYILPVFVSQDNAPVYNGLWFCLSATNLFVEYGDGLGDQNPAYRRGKSASIGMFQNRWIYVSAVVKSGNDIQLFLNGHNVGGAYTGSSTRPMASDFPNDVAKMGYFYTNDVLHRFKGTIDELRLWNRALAENELRESMCKRLKGDEQGLIGYWNFDETSGDVLYDLSSRGYNGILKGNPTRVFSGAPVGDESVFLYTTDWTGKSLSKDEVSVTDVSGTPYGIHIYSVNNSPSQTGGLEVANVQLPYYGVFSADDGKDNYFDLAFKNSVCEFFKRKDNSEPHWVASQAFSDILSRVEIVPSFEDNDLNLNLGPDETLCNRTSLFLEADPDPAGKTFVWNTGEKTSAITVTSSGKYFVEVRQDCLIDRDTVEILFLNSPPDFSLGNDEELCRMEPRVLTVNIENAGYDFTWHDGSNERSITANEFGTYWLKVENACGFSVDSVTVSQKLLGDVELYNFISPDNTDDQNQFFIVDEELAGAQLRVFNRWGIPVYQSSSYLNDWYGEGLAAGVYFYTIHSACNETLKGTLTIMR